MKRSHAIAGILAAALLSCQAFAGTVATNVSAAAAIPWKMPSYTLVARDMDLRVALDTFAVSQGLSVVLSDSVAGRFSGDFKDVPPAEFLEKISTIHNLMWYYDGAALYICGASEISTLLIDLLYMKAGEVRRMLEELGVEDSRFPLKTTSNDELVMVSGPPRYVSLIAEMVAKADKLRELRSFNEVEVRIFPLVNTWADDVSFQVSSPESIATIKGVARLIDDMMNSGSSAKIHEAVLTNEVSNIEASQISMFRPVIRPDNRLNAVVVRDVTARLPMYETIIRQLDVPQKLIEIGVTTVEFSRKDALDWQLSLANATKHGHSDGAVGQNPQNLFAPDALIGKGLAGSLTHIHASYSIASSLSALRERGKARNISRTTLITVNNLAAEMTDSQSYHARVVGTEVASLEEVSAGTRLQIKPRIVRAPSTNVSDQVWLSMRLDDGGFETVTVDAMPMTRSTTLQTQTAVFEGESILLAGYLRDIQETGGWGIPILRDIPWIGWLFGGATKRTETVQRMFVLTPRIIDLDTEALTRLQAAHLRDTLEEENLQDDAEDSEDERRMRELERKHRRKRRAEQADDAYWRREAELDHARRMRMVDRDREKKRLSDDKRQWRRDETEAWEKRAAEDEAALWRAMEEEARKDEEAGKEEWLRK